MFVFVNVVNVTPPFHVYHLTADEFKRLFKDYKYESVQYFYQKGALIVPEA